MRAPLVRPLCLLAIVLSSFVAESALSQEPYEARVFVDQGETLNYRLMRPAGYDAKGETPYPLVLFLHGAGERGSDNAKQLVHGSIPGLRARLLQEGPTLRPHINVFVDGEPGDLETPVGATSVVHVIPAVSGGST